MLSSVWGWLTWAAVRMVFKMKPEWSLVMNCSSPLLSSSLLSCPCFLGQLNAINAFLSSVLSFLPLPLSLCIHLQFSRTPSLCPLTSDLSDPLDFIFASSAQSICMYDVCAHPRAISLLFLPLYSAGHQKEGLPPPPYMGLFLLKVYPLLVFPCHCCFFGVQTLGFCKAPRHDFDCKRCFRNKDELNQIELNDTQQSLDDHNQ